MRTLSLACALLLAACDPDFNDIYCTDGTPPLPPKCARVGAGQAGSAGAPDSGGGAAGVGGRGGASVSGSGGQAGASGSAGKAGSGGIFGGKSGAGGGTSGSSGTSGASGGTAGAPGGKGGTAGSGGSPGGAGGLAGSGGSSGIGGKGGSAGASGGPPMCTLGKPACEAVVQVTLGRAHALLRRKDGAVFGWGFNDFGQLGQGLISPSVSKPQRIAGLVADLVSAAGDVTCLLGTDGAVSCVGDDTVGQLGRNAPVLGVDRAQPKAVSSLPVCRSVTVGTAHVCATEPSGAVHCWGDNRAEQLGTSPVILSRKPLLAAMTALPAPSTAALGLGATRACSPQPDGSVRCVGAERFLDDGANISIGPQPVDATANTAEVVHGRYFGCARQSPGGTVSCWGRGDEGQLGVGGASSDNRRPQALVIPDLENVVSLAAGESHMCASVSTGQVFCWGACDLGQCGDGKTVGSTATATGPALVPGVSAVAQVFAGGNGTCALMKSGSVSCWGAVAGAAPSASPAVLMLPP